MTDFTINFEPMGLEGKCHDDESILACARRLNIGLSNVCGGRGTCGTCRVQVKSGALSKLTQSEEEALSPQEIADGWRLACQATPYSDCQLTIPAESMSTSQRVYLEGLDITVTPEPPVKAYHLKLKAPSLSDQRADVDRLFAALDEQQAVSYRKIDTSILSTLSPQLRAWNWDCQASVRGDELVALAPWPSRQMGLAIDLGTTTIAGYLVDLSSGQTLASKGIINPQIDYGEDIISRINHVVKSPHEGKQLQKVVIKKFNELASDLCSEIGSDVEDIIEMTVVGNTAMHHLLLNLPVGALSISPFAPVVGRALDIKARELGMRIAPGAYIHFPPLIAAFVGSDHVSMLLAIDYRQVDGIVITLDIGTNTEISLINGEEITTTSCASGPAFEGGHIKHGIRATSGAIEKLRITKDTVHYQTIDGVPPIGICGSGILDAMAQLYLAGITDNTGRMINRHPRISTSNGQVEYCLVDKEEQDGHPAIVVTQNDIRELQLAKAAIRSGIQLLLETNNYTEEQIKQVVIGGAFGTYIDVSSAVTVGLLPSLPLDHFRQVGNAAGMGAKLALISLSKRKEAQSIVSRTHYIELATIPNFKQTFIEASYIGQYRMKHGRREEIE